MKNIIVLLIVFVAFSGFTFTRETGFSSVEFICLKNVKNRNTCHFNFKIDGANYRYVDIGCKYLKKRDKLIEKVQEGEIFLAKDWEIACPEPKEKKETDGL